MDKITEPRVWFLWSQAAECLADLQTIEGDAQALKIIKREGGFIYPLFNEIFPPPKEEGGAKMLLKMHRQATYQKILDRLYQAGRIKFYSPATLLTVQFGTVADPIVFHDEIASQIIEHSEFPVLKVPITESKPENQHQRKDNERADSLQSELVEILEKMTRDGEKATASRVMQMLKARAGNPDSCVKSDTAGGVKWERAGGEEAELSLKNLGKRISRWKDKYPR
ncbi:MAG: hypothetical protein P4L87_10145 [Formivibrio sp.]|nr:hypothetical protein [Formivibrio sp.]